jgi:hypothetical protein
MIHGNLAAFDWHALFPERDNGLKGAARNHCRTFIAREFRASTRYSRRLYAVSEMR